MTSLRPTVIFPAAHSRGGVERAALESLRFLAPRHPTVFVGYELEPTGANAPVRHVVPRRSHLARGALQPLGFRMQAASAIPQEPGTLTISHGVEAPPGSVYHVHSVHRAWLAAGRGSRVVRGIRVPNAARYLLPRHETLLLLEWDYFRRHRPQRLMAVSRAVADDLVRFYDVPVERIEVVPNGFDPVACNPTRRLSQRGEMRARLGIDADAIVALFVANELHRKGFSVLLEAVGLLRATPIEIHIVGRTPPDDFRHRIHELGLEHRVRYHGSTRDIGAFHAIADLLVLPTQYEPFGLVVVEALASGVPVITTAAVGVADRVHHDENGLLQTDPTDADELRSLLEMALDDDRRARWSANAPAGVSDLTWSEMGARVERVLLDLV